MKKKIATLTYHNVLNYGAVIQTYALQRFVNDNFENIDIEVLDYKSEFVTYSYSYKRLLKNFKTLPLHLVLLSLKKKKFNRFIKNYIRVSSQSFVKSNVASSVKLYDGFIVGSDQVWNFNLSGKDTSYLLDFVNSNKLKISYAASLGSKKLESESLTTFIKHLNSLNYISVRESTGSNFLAQNLNKSIYQHVDPALLLTAEEWKKISKLSKRDKKYILVYMIKYSEELLKAAVRLSEDKQIKVYFIGSPKKVRGVKYIINPSVERFINLFENAEYIMTNSFHGTVFSILFHKKFLVHMTYTDGRNRRMIDLLENLKMTKHIFSIETIDEIESEDDWDFIDDKIRESREKALEYLEKSFSEII